MSTTHDHSVASTNGQHPNRLAALDAEVIRLKRESTRLHNEARDAVEKEAKAKAAHIAATATRTEAVNSWRAAEKAEQAAREALFNATLDDVQ